jgi:hypothetical protein
VFESNLNLEELFNLTYGKMAPVIAHYMNSCKGKFKPFNHYIIRSKDNKMLQVATKAKFLFLK